MKIGDPVPKWRVPALIHGELTSFTLSRIKGKRMVVCCISSIAELEILLLNNQINHFEKYETALVVLVLSDFPFSESWILEPSDLRIPLLGDPLKRLRRRLSLSKSLSLPRCESLFFDQNGRLEFRLIHDLNIRGTILLLEILEMKLQRTLPPEPLEISPVFAPY